MDDETLTKFSRDYSLFKVRPQVVVFPKDAEDIKNLVKFVAGKKAAGRMYRSPDVRGNGHDRRPIEPGDHCFVHEIFQSYLSRSGACT